LISHSSFQRILFAGSLCSFILAGYTGFAYRWGLIGWLPEMLSLENIRHAHSHLMFFSWAVPLPMAVFIHYLKNQKIAPESVRKIQYSVLFILVTGLLTYPFFLFYGYRPVIFWSLQMPLSVIFSGIVMLGWYLFTYFYLRIRSQLTGFASSPIFDSALVMLSISSLGAWGVAVVQNMSGDLALISKALTHFFLAVFTEGWCLLSTLAVLWWIFKVQEKPAAWTQYALMLAAPFLFTIGLPALDLHMTIILVTKLALVLGVVALYYLGTQLYRSRPPLHVTHKVIMVLFAGLIAVKISALAAPIDYWIYDHGFRIFYLHLLLLGVLSLSLFQWLCQRFAVGSITIFLIHTSILLVLISLLALTKLWPLQWQSTWIPWIVAFTALLPPTFALLLLVRIPFSK